MSFNRYSNFKINGDTKNVPFIKMPSSRPGDKVEYYKKGVTRFDLLSYKYYKDPNYDWLILLCNSNLGKDLEFTISDGTKIIIPFPLDVVLNQYNDAVSMYKQYYGL